MESAGKASCTVSPDSWLTVTGDGRAGIAVGGAAVGDSGGGGGGDAGSGAAGNGDTAVGDGLVVGVSGSAGADPCTDAVGVD